MRRLALAPLIVAALAGPAAGNGRPPQTTGLHFRPGHENEILLAATFGALFSTDDGDTWTWMCETAVGYGGTYDPDYAISPAGTAFATTYDGIQIDRDGCRFELSSLGPTYASRVTVDSDGDVLFAMVYPGDQTEIPPAPPDYKIYRSTDDGMTFGAGTAIDTGGQTWISLEAAPSDPQRVYLTGYKLGSGNAKVLLLYRSDTGGAAFAPLAVTEFAVTTRSDLEIAAISPTDPDRVLIRVSYWNPDTNPGDAFYLTTDGGQGWTKVLEVVHDLARGVVFRASGDVVIGTFQSGIYRSIDQGQTFALVPGAQPAVYCLYERTDGSLWACTNNYDEPPFAYGVMKTTDLATWTGVMTFQDDIVGPVDCPVGTLQQDCCTIHTDACPFALTPEWCFLRSQLSIVASPITCDAPSDVTPPPPKTGGCCDSGAGPVGPMLLATLVAFGLIRRRRSGV